MRQGVFAHEVPGLIDWASSCLEESGVEKPRLNAELLLSHCTGRSRVQLYAYPEAPVCQGDREGFTQAVRRRAAREPLQYITGLKWFRYLELAVDRRAFIPRPETEALVEAALQSLSGLGGHPVVVDVGTGSGCIALSVAREHPAAVVCATDISADALEVALLNARRLGMERIISFRQGDLLGALGGEGKVRPELIVSNPPYVREADYLALPPEVREHEPYPSLVAGPEGTELHLRLMQQSACRLAPGGILLMEGGEGQVGSLAELAPELGYGEARVHPDLGGRPRMVEMRLPTA